jgi:quinol monooxygenase YgiN
MIALVVSLQVHPHRLDDFLAAIGQNAERSFRDEVGCRYFDVTQDRDDPLHFIFYELYRDEAAVEAHRAAPHFADWREAAADCVVPGSQVNTLCNQRFHHSYETDAD